MIDDQTSDEAAVAALRSHLCAMHGWDERDLYANATRLSLTVLHDAEHDPRLPRTAKHDPTDLGDKPAPSA